MAALTYGELFNGGSELLRKGACWWVLNGRRVKFWTDLWLKNRPLQDYALAPLSDDMLKAYVCDYWEVNRGWKWNEFNSWFLLVPCSTSPQFSSVLNTRMRTMLVGEDQSQETSQ